MKTPSAYFIPGRRVDLKCAMYYKEPIKWRLGYRVPPFNSTSWLVCNADETKEAVIDESRLEMPEGLLATMRKLIRRAR